MRLLILFVIFAIALLHEKAKGKVEEREYNNGICPKCGKRMRTLEDNWGNTIGFGCLAVIEHQTVISAVTLSTSKRNSNISIQYAISGGISYDIIVEHVADKNDE